MYISEIQICGKNDYEMHRDIYGAFPMNGSGRVLFRIYQDTIIVYSEKNPNWNGSRLKDLPVTVIASIQYKKDEILKFDLLVSPSIKRFGKRHAIVNEEELISWLVKKSKFCGFQLVNLKIFLNGQIPIKKDERVMYFNQVIFTGELIITDTAIFNQSIQNGIGTGKSFGFGLLGVEKIV
jgi:CRISPR system Cascade subunit CasE